MPESDLEDAERDGAGLVVLRIVLLDVGLDRRARVLGVRCHRRERIDPELGTELLGQQEDLVALLLRILPALGAPVGLLLAIAAAFARVAEADVERLVEILGLLLAGALPFLEQARAFGLVAAGAVAQHHLDDELVLRRHVLPAVRARIGLELLHPLVGRAARRRRIAAVVVEVPVGSARRVVVERRAGHRALGAATHLDHPGQEPEGGLHLLDVLLPLVLDGLLVLEVVRQRFASALAEAERVRGGRVLVHVGGVGVAFVERGLDQLVVFVGALLLLLVVVLVQLAAQLDRARLLGMSGEQRLEDFLLRPVELVGEALELVAMILAHLLELRRGHVEQDLLGAIELVAEVERRGEAAEGARRGIPVERA